MKTKKYNVWHVDMYHGWNDCDGPQDCNDHKEIIMDASLTKEDVIGMFCAKYKDCRVVSIWKCAVIASGEINLDE